jgi:hypothetical protein
MATLKPWYKVVTPREDLREGKPLDAAEFAVHLDQVRDGRAPVDYRDPQRFFERTYLTGKLAELGGEVVRRLAGEKTETSAVFNLTTQFGGGKTHALTMLYHLAKLGPKAEGLPGVGTMLEKAGVRAIPQAGVAVFVGTEFDSLKGRGGEDGTPVRRTPWGEIAFQLGGRAGLALVEEHEREFTEPKGDVIRAFLPKDRPCLILMDEILNYVSTYRRRGYHNALYNFLHALAETARGEERVVLAVSIPKSEFEYTAEDEADQQRLKKMLDRVGKAVILAAEGETSEIIRRRLFDWQGMPEEGRRTVAEYGRWVQENRRQLPEWFPIDRAREAFGPTYPFHPMVLSVFERKWRGLPRFQQTRGVLRLLALWVSRAYREGYEGAHRDLLIGMGTAPLEDSLFRAAVFEQLGEDRLEAAVTTDITGKRDAHAVRLDEEALESVRKARLHRKVATAVFFESNGGQLKMEATVPEVRLATGEPGLEIGNVETALERLVEACYYLRVEGNRYKFDFKENLNKRFADRQASIGTEATWKRVCGEVEREFKKGPSVERVFFPERSAQIPDRARLTLVVVGPERSMEDGKVKGFVEEMTREYGASARTYKSALVWCVGDSGTGLETEARKVLAWEAIEDEAESLRLDEEQKKQLAEGLKRAERDLRECVWRSYKYVLLLGKDGQIKTVDLGLVHSSAADSLVGLILSRLEQEGDVEKGVSPNFLVRHWPPAFVEWSTKAVRDAFFASPVFPRLLDADMIRETISRGVANGVVGYVGKGAKGEYEPFYYKRPLAAADVELSEDVYVIPREIAERYVARQPIVSEEVRPARAEERTLFDTRPEVEVPAEEKKETERETGVKRLTWSGEVPWQKWGNFFAKVLVLFSAGGGLRLRVGIEVEPQGGISKQKVEETRAALRELGLEDRVEAGD